MTSILHQLDGFLVKVIGASFYGVHNWCAVYECDSFMRDDWCKMKCSDVAGAQVEKCDD